MRPCPEAQATYSTYWKISSYLGVPANHLSAWRTLARTGRLVLPAPEDPAEFASLIVGPVDSAPLGKTGAQDRPEIVMGAVVIRLEAGASAERSAAVR